MHLTLHFAAFFIQAAFRRLAARRGRNALIDQRNGLATPLTPQRPGFTSTNGNSASAAAEAAKKEALRAQIEANIRIYILARDEYEAIRCIQAAARGGFVRYTLARLCAGGATPLSTICYLRSLHVWGDRGVGIFDIAIFDRAGKGISAAEVARLSGGRATKKASSAAQKRARRKALGASRTTGYTQVFGIDIQVSQSLGKHISMLNQQSLNSSTPPPRSMWGGRGGGGWVLPAGLERGLLGFGPAGTESPNFMAEWDAGSDLAHRPRGHGLGDGPDLASDDDDDDVADDADGYDDHDDLASDDDDDDVADDACGCDDLDDFISDGDDDCLYEDHYE